MTSSQIAAIEVREQRIAYLERRLTERENLVALLADRCAKAAMRNVRLRKDVATIRRSIEQGEEGMTAGEYGVVRMPADSAQSIGWARVLCDCALDDARSLT